MRSVAFGSFTSFPRLSKGREKGLLGDMLKVKKILVSQPAPADYEKSPYKAIADKFNLEIVFKKLFQIEGIPALEFRKNKINLLEYTAVVLTSRNAVDHYFRLAKEMRAQIPITMKFFCSSESVAFYIQNYIQYRKRKIFYGKQTTADLMEVITKHKDEKFLFPCSEDSNSDVPAAFTKAKIALKKAPMYRTVPAQVSDILKLDDVDMLVLFSPVGVKSLFENYPGFEQGNRLVATFGTSVAEAARQAGLTVNLLAPTPTSSSMVQALEEFLNDLSKHGGDLSKIAAKYAYNNSSSPETAVKPKPVAPPKEDKEPAPAKAKKAVESKVAANKAAALAVIAGKKGGRVTQMAKARE